MSSSNVSTNGGWELFGCLVGQRMIAGTLKKFANAILGNQSPSTVQGFLRPIDTARIAGDIDLDRLARDRGRNELPDSTAATPDSVEQQITQRIVAEWTWQGQELIHNLRAYADRLIGYSIQSELQKLQLTANNALARLRDANHRAEADLGPLREAYISARDELERFRSRHRLERSARNPARRWTTFGLLFILIGIESCLNGFFFAKGSAHGYLGGIGTAIGISLTNVIFAFGIGIGPSRWVNHRNLMLKLLGLAATMGGAAAVLGLHAFAAHFREATAAVGEERAMLTAIHTFVRSPTSLTDLNSFYLFGLGVIFAFSAYWKGYTFDDPYPGYGALFRRTSDARDAYSDEHVALFKDLEDLKEQAVDALADGISRIPLFPQQAVAIRAQRAAMVQTFRGYETNVETAVNQLLARYRDMNRSNRNTPTPLHFNSTWLLPFSFVEKAEVRELTADSQHAGLNVDATLAELRRLTSLVLDEYEMLITSYPHPTQMQ